MHDKHFWDLIDWTNTRSDLREEREDALEEELRQLPLESIEDFYLLYDQRITQAWTKELKCAAYLINHYEDGMDEQNFLWFVCWLIDRGKPVYDAALSNPDTLADIDEELPWGSDGYWDSAIRAWQVTSGKSESEFTDRVTQRGASGPVDLPSGGGVSDRYLKRAYPRLFRRYAEELD